MRPSRPLNTYDLLKIIAIITMVVDHLGVYIFKDAEWMRGIGRTAFPLFLFLVGYSESWHSKKDLWIYALLIVVVGLITRHPPFPLNILFAIAATRLVMQKLAYKLTDKKFLRGLFLIGVCWYPVFLWIDYGSMAILFAVAGFLMAKYPEEHFTKPFLYSTILAHFVIQFVCFNFTAEFAILCTLSAIIVTLMTKNFTIKDLHIAHVNRLGLFISRNAIHIYGIHVMALMIAEWILFPARHPHFMWMML